MTAGARPIHRWSIISLVLGLMAFPLIFVAPYAAFVLALPCITTGVHARREIADSDGTVRGHDFAGYGVTLGAATMAVLLVLFALSAFSPR